MANYSSYDEKYLGYDYDYGYRAGGYDAPNNVNSDYSLGTGEAAYGYISSSYDKDYYSLGYLSSGSYQYTVQASGTSWASNTSNGQYNTPDVSIYDASGNLVKSGAGGSVTFRLGSSGYYHVAVSDSSASQYQLTLSEVYSYNYYAPAVTNDYAVSLNENSIAGTSVHDVYASDSEGDGITYAIYSGNKDVDGDGHAAFAIRSSDGLITVNDAGDLNYEGQSSFSLSVSASDGSKTGYGTVEVYLNDLTEGPTLSAYGSSVKENSGYNTYAGHVYASNYSGTDSYSITGGNVDVDGDGSLPFYIAKASYGYAYIYVNDAGDLNYESQSQFDLKVSATDYYGTTTTAAMVYLTNVNEAPVLSASTLYVNENSDYWTSVGTVSGSDPEGSTLNYSIMSGNTDVDGDGSLPFHLTSSGQIYVYDTGDLNYESRSSFALTVRAMDSVYNSTTATTTVYLNDVREGPTLSASGSSINENSGYGTSAGYASASSYSGTVTYSITDGNIDVDGDGDAAFAIDSSTGVITVNDADDLDYEDIQFFNLTVEASDGFLSTSTTATVNLANVNDAPTGAVTISGTATQGRTLTAANTLADADGLGTISYQWRANGSAISGATGSTLTLGQEQAGKAISVTASYTDGQGNTESITSPVTIALVSINTAPTFKVGNGKVTTDFGASPDFGYSVALQTDGKILLAGASGGDFALARYDADGSLDSSFGSDGKLTTDFGLDDAGYAVTVQTDGKIVVAGSRGSDYYSGSDFALARYNVDGSLDTSFSVDGKLTTDLGSSTDSGQSVALQADGKIVVAGSSGSNYYSNDFALARYNADGSLDISFSSDGKLTTDFGSSNDNGRSVALQVDGKILVAGYSNGFALARYNVDGSLDTSFSGDGVLTTAIGSSSDGRNGVTLQTDGKILVAGYGNGDSSFDFALARYNADGSLDTSFSEDGMLTTDFGSYDYGESVALQADGKILVAGSSARSDSGAMDEFSLARYNADGSLDTSFSGDGKLTTAIGTYQEVTGSVALQADGKILVAGYSYSHGSASYDFALVRYNPDGSLDTGFNPISNTLDGTLTYTENGGAVRLDSDVQIFDAELNAVSYAGASLTLSRHGGASNQDVFSGAGSLGALTEGGDLSFSEQVIGTVTQNSGGTLVLSFNNAATQGLVNSTLQGIAYSNSSDVPSASVQIDWAFSDGNTGAQGIGGAWETSGSTTVAIAAVNDVLTGAVTISGTAMQGQTLTASNTLADVDGLGTISYQWKANGIDIGGVTGSSYTLTQAEVGQTITVKASYTDGQGAAESMTSSATTAVANVEDEATGTLTVTGSIAEGGNLTAILGDLTDADGISTTAWQWQISQDGNTGWTDLATETSENYTIASDQSQVGQYLRVIATTIDVQGGSTSFTGAASRIANVNDAVTGSVTISGTATQGQILTASNNLADVDGLGTISYQWLANGNEISGATASGYTLTASDVGQAVSVRASYTDGGGTIERVTSTTMAAVSALPGVTFGNASPGQLVTTEAGGTDSFTVALRAAPRDNVTLSFTISDATEAVFAASGKATHSVTFTAANWTKAQTVVLCGVDDKPEDGDMAYTIATSVSSSDLRYDGMRSGGGLSIANLVAQTTDNDAPDEQYGDQGGIASADLIQGGNGASDLYGLSARDEVYGNNGDDRLYGGYGDDVLYGNADNDELEGDQGNDKLDGGTGNDSLNGGTGNDSLYGQAGNDNLLGEAGNDLLFGGDGNDTLNGGTDADSMDGGNGADVYYIDNAADQVRDSGTDTAIDTVYIMVYLSGGITLGAGIDNGTLNELAGKVSLTGNTGNNVLTGNAEENVILGGEGTDTLSGGAGGDTLDGGVGDDTLDGGVGTDNLTGGAGNDSLSGGLGDDILYSGAGDDVVDAGDGADLIIGGDGAGNDRYNGGAGIDTVKYTSATASITVNLGTGSASGVNIGQDTLVGIEDLIGGKGSDSLTGSAVANRIDGDTGNDAIKGEAGNDTLIGGAGNDTLDGGTGADSMVGGDGSDSYTVDHISDKVVETNASASTGGTDLVFSSLSAYTLAANVENGRIVAAGNANLAGNALNNLLYAGAGNNVVNGAAGIDTLSYLYATAAVTLDLSKTVAQATGGSGSDTISNVENFTGSNFNDKLTGSSAANALNGGAGNDTLNGGKGADVLTGGTGKDSFLFAAGSSGQATGFDMITDYAKGVVGTGDLIDYSALLSKGGVAAAAVVDRASINATTGVATFASGSGATLADALADVARSLSVDGLNGAAKDVAGEFAFFKVNGTGNHHLFISDGAAGVTANDVVVQLVGVTGIGGIDLTGGNLTITS